MGKYVSIKDQSGFDFTHNFSDSDWEKLCTLCGCRTGSVELSEGPASIDGRTVFISLNSPGGRRLYELPAASLFD